VRVYFVAEMTQRAMVFSLALVQDFFVTCQNKSSTAGRLVGFLSSSVYCARLVPLFLFYLFSFSLLLGGVLFLLCCNS
jgi:hypothetical protein